MRKVFIGIIVLSSMAMSISLYASDTETTKSKWNRKPALREQTPCVFSPLTTWIADACKGFFTGEYPPDERRYVVPFEKKFFDGVDAVRAPQHDPRNPNLETLNEFYYDPK